MEFNQVLDWRAGPGVCRCCLSEGCYKDISTEYFWMGEKEIYAEMLLECYSLTISYQEGRPNSNSRLICEVCITRLRDAANFKKQVINSERNFAKHLIEVPVEREVEVTYTPTESLPIQQVKDESRVSDDGDFDDSQFDANFDCDDDADDQPLKNFATNVLKREDTVPDVTVEKVKTKDGKSPSKRKAAAKKGGVSPAKKAKAMKQEKEAKPSSSKPPKTERKKGPRNGQETRSNIIAVLENTTACPFSWWRSSYKCVYCTFKVVHDFAQLRRHVVETHGGCTATARDIKIPSRPVKLEISAMSCKICSTKLDTVDIALRHLKDRHSLRFSEKANELIIPFKLCNDSFICTLCDLPFDMFSALSSHMNAHSTSNICEVCGKSFTDSDRLYTHRQMHITEQISCSTCKMAFTSRSAFKSHVIRVHHDSKKLHACPLCPERFKSSQERGKHLVFVHNDMSFEFRCEKCNKAYYRRSTLQQHRRHVHRQTTKFYVCPECGKQFTLERALSMHLRMHTGERPLECKLCHKSFARPYTLQVHMETHNKDRVYSCEVCQANFTQKRLLRKHIECQHCFQTP